MSYSGGMKPWAWLLIFFLTVGASVYLWKKSPPSDRGPVPIREAGENTPQGLLPNRPVEMVPTNKEPGPNRLPSPRVVQPASPSNSNAGNEVPAEAPKDSPSDFNPPPIPQPPGFYPPPGAPEGEMGYPGYVPPPGSMPPEEGENGFVPQPFEPPPPLDEEFIPPPPPPENDSEL